MLVRQRTAFINALRAHLAEYGVVTATGPGGVSPLAKLLQEKQDALPPHARAALSSLVEQLGALAEQIDRLEGQILEWHRSDETSRRLATIPGIRTITASAIAAAVPDPGQFRSGRQFAAWLGLTPRPNSSGCKERLGGISKQGDGYLGRLLVVGATAVVSMVRKDPRRQHWLAELLERKTVRVATVGLANKTARIAWAVMTRKEVYAT